MTLADTRNAVVRRKCGSSEGVPVLYYSRFAGKAEAIRFCFAYGGIDFVDVRFPFEKWATHYKSLSPFGLVPWLEVDGVQYAESQAILQYAAKRAGLVPQNPEAYIGAMSILEMKESIEKCIYVKVKEQLAKYSAPAPIPQLYSKIFATLISDESVLSLLRQLDTFIEKTQDQEGHLIGGELTFADMSIAAYTRMLADFSNSNELEQMLPHMYRCMKKVYSLPSIHKYVISHNYDVDLYCDDTSVTAQILRLMLSIADVQYNYQGTANMPRLSTKGETLAEGFRSCCLWINNRHNLLPAKSSTHLLGMWSIVDLICNMSATWGASVEVDRTTLERVNRTILKTQAREGFCIGRALTLADLAAASFYEFYLNGHSVGASSSDLEAFRNAHRVVYQIPGIVARPLKSVSVPMLVYFNFAGKGEAIRLLCHAANIQFSDVRISLAQWTESEHRKKSPNGKLPYMIIDDKTHVEQVAILTLLAARCDMLPSTAMGRYLAHAVESALHDLTPTLVQLFKVKTVEEKKCVLMEGLLDFLDVLEALIQRHKSAKSLPHYLVEDRLTYADFLIAGLMAGFPEELQLDMSRWAVCKAIYDHITAIPQILKYRQERGPLESLLSDGGETSATRIITSASDENKAAGEGV